MEFTSIKSIFFRYILIPLIMVVLITVMGFIRRSRPAIKIKHIIIYVLLAGLCLGLPGFLGFSGNKFNPYWYIFSQFLYLGLGIIHVNLLHYYFRKHFTSITKSMLFESILTFTCILFGGFLFSLLFRWMSDGLGNEYMAASSCLVFILPLIFYYTYVQFISIPLDIFKTWQYDPEQKPFNFSGIDFDRLMVLNVELSKNSEDQQRFSIKAKTLPTEISYGDWFFRVVDDYNHKNPNSKINLFDETGTPFYWIFYVKKSFFSIRHYIDYEKNITENRITENEMIICKRVILHKEEGTNYMLSEHKE